MRVGDPCQPGSADQRIFTLVYFESGPRSEETGSHAGSAERSRSIPSGRGPLSMYQSTASFAAQYLPLVHPMERDEDADVRFLSRLSNDCRVPDSIQPPVD